MAAYIVEDIRGHQIRIEADEFIVKGEFVQFIREIQANSELAPVPIRKVVAMIKDFVIVWCPEE